MKATHKAKHGSQDMVYHRCSETGTIYVSVKGRPWKVSAFNGFDVFDEVMTKIVQFKGNK